MKTVVLLTAGTGTRMGKYSSVINKTLLPIKDKAIISHIISQFDEDTKFVVALGYRGDMVKTYLELAHETAKFTFVEVEDFDGPGAGPAQSLLQCRDALDGPFYVIACDAHYEGLNTIDENTNVVCVAPVSVELSPAYCNVELHGSRITKIVDKQYCTSGLAVSGAFFIKDTEPFWNALTGSELSSGWSALETHAVELPWHDLGTFDKYQAFYLENSPYDFSKTDEFLYIINGRVIKWFRDKTITDNRVLRIKGREHLFPTIDFQKDGFYSYKFVPGEVLYQCITSDIFDKFLKWMSFEVWPVEPSVSIRLNETMCRDFYYTKTMKRLDMFRDKYPDFNPKVINNQVMKVDLDNGLKLINWKDICEGELYQRSAFIHGDLQFDNVIYDGNRFTLLDWRQDFAGSLQVGDLYYDVAKLVGGMILDYGLIRQNQFTFSEDGDSCHFATMTRNNYSGFIDRLQHLLPSPIIRDLVTIIFLNMAPLHSAPFDKLLYCLALERLNELA